MINKKEFQEKFPITWEYFERARENGKDYIGWSSGTIMRKDIEGEIKRAGYTKCSQVLDINSHMKMAKLYDNMCLEVSKNDEFNIVLNQDKVKNLSTELHKIGSSLIKISDILNSL